MEKINAVMIFEIMGKPAEHIIQTISSIIDSMSKEKGVKILNKRVEKAKKIENSELFTSFAEVEAEIDDLKKLMMVIFAYMPAHIDIIYPSDIKIKNFDLNLVCNELITKLHTYDSVAKTLMFEKNNLISQLKQATGQDYNLPANIKRKKAKTMKKLRAR